MYWKNFSDELPTTTVGEQVKVLLFHPEWATCVMGLYTHFPSCTLHGRVAEYHADIDRYTEIEGTLLPTHWLLIPEFRLK